MFFFFKQKRANELRISDWSSDVCTSDLQREAWQAPENALPLNLPHLLGRLRLAENRMQPVGEFLDMRVMTREIVEMRQFFPEQRILRQGAHQDGEEIPSGDRKSVVSGKSVSVRVDLGGRRIIKKKNQTKYVIL